MEIANADHAESDNWQSFAGNGPEVRPVGVRTTGQASWFVAEFPASQPSTGFDVHGRSRERD